MLIKLLKYDLKYMIKNMSVFYILSIFFAITTRLLSLLEQTVMIGILSKISSGCMIAMIANVVINVMMRSWVRFRDSLYKDEAYLTHTLPVTNNDLYKNVENLKITSSIEDFKDDSPYDNIIVSMNSIYSLRKADIVSLINPVNLLSKAFIASSVQFGLIMITLSYLFIISTSFWIITHKLKL